MNVEVEILVTTTVPMVSGAVGVSTVIVTARGPEHAEKITQKLRSADQSGGRVHYNWVILD